MTLNADESQLLVATRGGELLSLDPEPAILGRDAQLELARERLRIGETAGLA